MQDCSNSSWVRSDPRPHPNPTPVNKITITTSCITTTTIEGGETIFSIAFLSKYSGIQWLKCHPLICMIHRRLHFYFDPEKLILPNLLTKHSSLTFSLCFYLIVGICGTFWHNLASSKPMFAISLCMGCCQVVCLSEHLWPRLAAWLSRLGVTINCCTLCNPGNHSYIATTGPKP